MWQAGSPVVPCAADPTILDELSARTKPLLGGYRRTTRLSPDKSWQVGLLDKLLHAGLTRDLCSHRSFRVSLKMPENTQYREWICNPLQKLLKLDLFDRALPVIGTEVRVSQRRGIGLVSGELLDFELFSVTPR
jgi:hypothetical protein